MPPRFGLTASNSSSVHILNVIGGIPVLIYDDSVCAHWAYLSR
jgi:hypothetical protein